MTPEQRKERPKRKMRDNYDLVGHRFGSLVVVCLLDERYITPNGSPRKQWRCLCDCGNTTVDTTNNLCMNRRKSCGCACLLPENLEIRRQSGIKRRKQDTGVKELYGAYKRNAKNRNTVGR